MVAWEGLWPRGWRALDLLDHSRRDSSRGRHEPQGWTAEEGDGPCPEIQLAPSAAKKVKTQQTMLSHLGDPDRVMEGAASNMNGYVAMSQHGGLLASDGD